MRQSEFKRRYDVKKGGYVKKHFYGKGVATDEGCSESCHDW